MSTLSKIVRTVFLSKWVKIDQKFIIFLFFIFVATIFWFLTALSKNVSATISYPVDYINFPPKKFSIGELPEKLTLKVNGNGFTILKYNFSTRFLPIEIDVSSHPLARFSSKDTSHFFLLTNSLLTEISSQLSSDITIIDIVPDTLKFEFTNIISKKVPVKADIKPIYERQYMQIGQIKIKPDSVVISGPQTLLQNINSVKTCFKKYKKLSSTINERLCIAEIKGEKISKDAVDIVVPVEKYTEASVNIPLDVVNPPQKVSLRVFPHKISVSFNVSLNDYPTINQNQFKAVADYSTIDNQISNKLKVNLVQYPEKITNVKINPVFVEFLIEK